MKGYAEHIGARPPAEFFGREPQLDAVARLADDAQRRQARWLVFEGPAGSGRSELLRQAAVRLLARRPPLMPVRLDAGQSPPDLIRSAIGQVLAHAGAIELGVPVAVERSGALLHQAGLGELEGVAARSAGDEAAWRLLWRALRGRGLPPPIVFMDGGAAAAPPREFVEAAVAEKISVVADGPVAVHDVDVEYGALGPLAAADAVAYAQTILQGCGRGFDPALLESVLVRLGPWPAWVRAWAEMLRRGGGREADWSAPRLVEQTYVDFLVDSMWSRALAEGIRRAVGPARCGRALALARAAAEEARPLDAGRALEILGLPEERLDGALAALERIGLVQRSGFGWAGPCAEAVADWVRIELAREAGGGVAAAAPLDLLGRRLTAPRRSAPEGPSVEKIFEAMNGQAVPEALFHLADYHEALGALPAGERREAVMKSARTISLPEVVGTAPWRRADRPRLVFARAYRGGQYQRSHEEVWIAIDRMDSRALTTAEIHEALAEAEVLERQLGPGRYVYWLLAGAEASPEALQWLHDRQVFCSGREQLAHLADLLKPAPARIAEVSPHPRARIVGLDEERRPPAQPVAPGRLEKARRLALPARPESEQEAVRAAEAFAREAGFEAADVGRIKTAALEGVLNAIEHSADPEKIVRIEMGLTARNLEIVIENEGRPFDPLAVAEPDPVAKLTAVNKRGWGISLMKRFMDEVGYEPIAGGTRLRLVKRRPQGRPAAGEVIETGISRRSV